MSAKNILRERDDLDRSNSIPALKDCPDYSSLVTQLGLTATTASPMAGYGRGHSFFLKMAIVAEF